MTVTLQYEWLARARVFVATGDAALADRLTAALASWVHGQAMPLLLSPRKKP